MTELQLYKFVNDNNLEYHWYEHEGRQDVILFIPHYALDKFTSLIKHNLEEEGMEVTLKDCYICVWMYDLCENNDIHLTDIFKPE